MDLLKTNFGSNSSNNEKYKDLWCKSAQLLIPQLNTFYDSTLETKHYGSLENEKTKITEDVFWKYGTDKAKQNFHYLYSHVLMNYNENSNINILEIGIGTQNTSLVSSMHNKKWIPGGSLRSFKSLLKNANIYGADIDRDVLFTEENIKTSYVDQLNINTYTNMNNNFNNIKYDIIIDDGLHAIGANINTIIFALRHINPNGWIIIEDISREQLENWHLVNFMIKQSNNIETFIVNTEHHLSYMFVIHML